MKKIALALCVTLAAAVPAYAKTLTIDLEKLPSATSLNSLLNIQRFDPSLGTLTGIEIDYSALVTTNVTLTGLNTVQGKKANVGTVATISLKRPDATVLATASNPVINTTYTVDGKQFISGIKGTTTVSLTAFLTDSSDLGMFTGSGFVGTPFTAKVNITGSGATGVLAKYDSNVSGFGKVIYTYNAAPVPEPETYGMLLLGLGVVGFAAQRKSRAAKV